MSKNHDFKENSHESKKKQNLSKNDKRNFLYIFSYVRVADSFFNFLIQIKEILQEITDCFSCAIKNSFFIFLYANKRGVWE